MTTTQICVDDDIKVTTERVELNDGHGSHICEYGYLHDFKKLGECPEFVEAVEDVRSRRNLHGPFDSAGKAVEAMLEGE